MGSRHVGPVHVLGGGRQVVHRQRGMRRAEIEIHPVQGGKNVAANIQALRLLLAADTLHAGACSIGSGFDVHEAVIGLANLLLRGSGGGRGGCIRSFVRSSGGHGRNIVRPWRSAV